MSRQRQHLAFHRRHCGRRVPMHRHQRRLPATLPNLQLVLVDDHIVLGDLQIDPPAFHDEDVPRLIAFVKNDIALSEPPMLQALENRQLLRLRDSTENAQLRENGADGVKVRKGNEFRHDSTLRETAAHDKAEKAENPLGIGACAVSGARPMGHNKGKDNVKKRLKRRKKAESVALKKSLAPAAAK